MAKTEIVTIGEKGRTIRDIEAPASTRAPSVESFNIPCFNCAADGRFVASAAFIKKRDPFSAVAACTMHASELLETYRDTSRIPLREAVDSPMGWKLWPQAIQLSDSLVNQRWKEGGTPFCLMCLAYFDFMRLGLHINRDVVNVTRIYAQIQAQKVAWTPDGGALPVCDFHTECLSYLQVKKNRPNRLGGVITYDEWKSLGVSNWKKSLKATLGDIAGSKPAANGNGDRDPESVRQLVAPSSPMSRRAFRSILGVSNRFTEAVAEAMTQAGMVVVKSGEAIPELDAKALIAATGLEKEALRRVLADGIFEMEELEAIFKALPSVRSFFVRRPAPCTGTRESWKKAAHEGFSKHRLRTGMTVQEQANLLGLSLHDFQRLEDGLFSPSIDEFLRIQENIPELSANKLAIGIPTLAAAVCNWLDMQKMKMKGLASRTRIPLHRIEDIIGGAQPVHEEFARLRAIIPNLPSWFDRTAVKKDSPSSPVSVAAVDPSPSSPKLHDPVVFGPVQVSEVALELMQDPESPVNLEPAEPEPEPDSPESEPESEPVPTMSSPPVSKVSVERVPIASDHPGLTEVERERILMVEEALLRLSSPGEYRRDQLFPDDLDGQRWQLEYLKKLTSANIVVRKGERNFTTYIGVKDRVEDLLKRPDWLLRLLAPQARIRLHSEPVVSDETGESPAPDGSLPPSIVMSQSLDVRLSEIQRLLPDYYDVLLSFRQRIVSLESEVLHANSKLDALLTHFKIPIPAMETADSEAKDEDGTVG